MTNEPDPLCRCGQRKSEHQYSFLWGQVCAVQPAGVTREFTPVGRPWKQHYADREKPPWPPLTSTQRYQLRLLQDADDDAYQT